MSIKGFIAKLLPQSLLNKLLINKDRKQLGQLDSLECNISNLGSFSSDNVKSFFRSEEISSAWEKAEAKISGFQIPDMTGGVNPGDRRAIYYLAKALQAKSVLEVGTHIGASTIHLALAVSENSGTEAKPHLTSVDIADVNDQTSKPWLQHGSSKSPREMVNELECRFVEFRTEKSLRFMENCGQKFDLIFLDGDHSAQTTYQEIPAALKLLNPGGVILLHDYFPHLKPLWSNGNVISGPCLAGERLIAENKQVQVIPLGDLPWSTKLNSNRTSLALLCRR